MSRKLALLALVVSAPFFAGQASPILDQAFEFLSKYQYQAARDRAQYYLDRNPPSYRAEFIRAASDCYIEHGSDMARKQMRDLKYYYVLTPRAVDNINNWLNKYCVPPPPKIVSSNGESSSSDYITAQPNRQVIASAASSEPSPLRLPRMSSMRYSTSFSGDDYRHYDGIQSPEQCAEICRRQELCRSMTYIKSDKICWLKRSMPAAQHGDDFVSAFKIVEP